MGNNLTITYCFLHFESFNKEYVTIKEEEDRYLLSQKTKLKSVCLLLN